MAVRARQTYIQQQPELPQQQQQEQRLPVQPKKRKAKYFSAQEKFLFLVFAIVVASFAISILHTQGEIQTLSMEIQKIERDITEVNNNNTDLKVQVSERSTHQRIWEKAKELGLTLNEKNVKVVPGE
ncbi:cell division protein FtsL [Solibacillus sp. FSL W7-1472]|uniref:Cell division protein FtsL n=1 Tax=Solibacillus silvestris (strain StLB046) TaxID=1002809 RepID=F2F707_SOLSS|nr:cell division protein FtsL [Solibacillus silvestris]OBW58628.1 cell division protein FtsL [Solibacillus silvestris]BAK17526.1 protein required for the initiation of cell division [Solibacillus silvestris StLB046]